MRVSRVLNGVVLACALVVAGIATAGSVCAQTDAELKVLNRQVQQLYQAGKYAGALPIAERYVSAAKQRHGEGHTEYATAISWLAQLLQDTNQLAEAEPLMRRALTIDEKSFGPDHPNVARDLGNLAELLRTNGLAEAEPLMRRALSIDEKSFGPEHPNVAIRLSNLAELLRVTNRLAEAEPLTRRALSIDEKSFGPEHPDVAIRLNNLAVLLQTTNRLAEAEPLMRRVIAIFEKSLGPEHPNVAASLNNLAELLRIINRLAEAEQLTRRALSINEKSFGLEHPKVATSLNNLAVLLQAANRLAEAEPLMRRVIAIFEKSLGPEHPNVATSLNNLGEFLRTSNSLAEAEPLYRRALAIDEKSFGSTHPDVARDLSNLALLLKASNRLAEAEPLYRRALEIDEKSWGLEHPNVATAVNHLAVLLAERGDWAEAAALGRRAKPILIARKTEQSGDRAESAKATLAGNTWPLRAHARAEHRANADNADAREEGFELAQWALQTSAAQALSQMSARSAKGAGSLAQLAREREDAVAHRAGEDKLLLAALGRGDAPASEIARKSLASLDSALDALDARLSSEFKEYAELANPKPLTIAAVQAAYRIVHFATHGALAGEFKSGTEPGLLFTPPSEATAEDDGYLSASEIAGLKLDADWVILSACNTAAGGAEGAEALSGVSRAFFYAGARALLVSHWGVDLDATVKLITKALSTMAADKTVGRAEALRRSMVALIERGEPQEAHPAYWAPFVVVGEGSAAELAAKPLATSSIVPGPQPPSASRQRPGKRVMTPDWRTQIWRQ